MSEEAVDNKTSFGRTVVAAPATASVGELEATLERIRYFQDQVGQSDAGR